MTHRKSEAISGCILGGAIGDAVASAFEGSCKSVSDHRNWQDGVWQITDDTQLTLATCEALTERGSVDPAGIAESFLRWFRDKRLCRVGSSTLKALRDLDAGCHWALAGRKGDHAAGNGAAMRIAPLAFCLDPQTSNGRQLIRDVCRITHHSDEAYAGAVAIVLAIRSSVALSEPPSLGEIASKLPDSVVRDRLLNLGAQGTTSIAEAASVNGCSGYVAESVPLALFASQQVAAIGFVEMIEQIIQAGGDTDTIASMAGQVAGAALGVSGLPSHLIEHLPDRVMILKMANQFAQAVHQWKN